MHARAQIPARVRGDRYKRQQDNLMVRVRRLLLPRTQGGQRTAQLPKAVGSQNKCHVAAQGGGQRGGAGNFITITVRTGEWEEKASMLYLAL